MPTGDETCAVSDTEAGETEERVPVAATSSGARVRRMEGPEPPDSEELARENEKFRRVDVERLRVERGVGRYGRT
jgi:hypothetical protein